MGSFSLNSGSGGLTSLDVMGNKTGGLSATELQRGAQSLKQDKGWAYGISSGIAGGARDMIVTPFALTQGSTWQGIGNFVAHPITGTSEAVSSLKTAWNTGNSQERGEIAGNIAFNAFLFGSAAKELLGRPSLKGLVESRGISNTMEAESKTAQIGDMIRSAKPLEQPVPHDFGGFAERSLQQSTIHPTLETPHAAPMIQPEVGRIPQLREPVVTTPEIGARMPEVPQARMPEIAQTRLPDTIQTRLPDAQVGADFSSTPTIRETQIGTPPGTDQLNVGKFRVTEAQTVGVSGDSMGVPRTDLNGGGFSVTEARPGRLPTQSEGTISFRPDGQAPFEPIRPASVEPVRTTGGEPFRPTNFEPPTQGGFEPVRPNSVEPIRPNPVEPVRPIEGVQPSFEPSRPVFNEGQPVRPQFEPQLEAPRTVRPINEDPVWQTTQRDLDTMRLRPDPQSPAVETFNKDLDTVRAQMRTMSEQPTLSDAQSLQRNMDNLVQSAREAGLSEGQIAQMQRSLERGTSALGENMAAREASVVRPTFEPTVEPAQPRTLTQDTTFQTAQRDLGQQLNTARVENPTTPEARTFNEKLDTVNNQLRTLPDQPTATDARVFQRNVDDLVQSARQAGMPEQRIIEMQRSLEKTSTALSENIAARDAAVVRPSFEPTQPRPLTQDTTFQTAQRDLGQQLNTARVENPTTPELRKFNEKLDTVNTQLRQMPDQPTPSDARILQRNMDDLVQSAREAGMPEQRIIEMQRSLDKTSTALSENVAAREATVARPAVEPRVEPTQPRLEQSQPRPLTQDTTFQAAQRDLGQELKTARVENPSTPEARTFNEKLDNVNTQLRSMPDQPTATDARVFQRNVDDLVQSARQAGMPEQRVIEMQRSLEKTSTALNENVAVREASVARPAVEPRIEPTQPRLEQSQPRPLTQDTTFQTAQRDLGQQLNAARVERPTTPEARTFNEKLDTVNTQLRTMPEQPTATDARVFQRNVDDLVQSARQAGMPEQRIVEMQRSLEKTSTALSENVAAREASVARPAVEPRVEPVQPRVEQPRPLTQDTTFQTAQRDLGQQLNAARVERPTTPEARTFNEKLDTVNTQLRTMPDQPTATDARVFQRNVDDLVQSARQAGMQEQRIVEMQRSLEKTSTALSENVAARETAVVRPAVEPRLEPTQPRVEQPRALTQDATFQNAQRDLGQQLKQARVENPSTPEARVFNEKLDTVNSQLRTMPEQPTPSDARIFQRNVDDLVQSARQAGVPEQRIIEMQRSLEKTSTALTENVAAREASVARATIEPRVEQPRVEQPRALTQDTTFQTAQRDLGQQLREVRVENPTTPELRNFNQKLDTVNTQLRTMPEQPTASDARVFQRNIDDLVQSARQAGMPEQRLIEMQRSLEKTSTALTENVAAREASLARPPVEPRIEPRVEQPRVEQPRVEQPRAEQPRAEQPRAEQPRQPLEQTEARSAVDSQPNRPLSQDTAWQNSQRDLGRQLDRTNVQANAESWNYENFNRDMNNVRTQLRTMPEQPSVADVQALQRNTDRLVQSAREAGVSERQIVQLQRSLDDTTIALRDNVAARELTAADRLAPPTEVRTPAQTQAIAESRITESRTWRADSAEGQTHIQSMRETVAQRPVAEGTPAAETTRTINRQLDQVSQDFQRFTTNPSENSVAVRKSVADLERSIKETPLDRMPPETRFELENRVTQLKQTVNAMATEDSAMQAAFARQDAIGRIRVIEERTGTPARFTEDLETSSRRMANAQSDAEFARAYRDFDRQTREVNNWVRENSPADAADVQAAMRNIAQKSEQAAITNLEQNAGRLEVRSATVAPVERPVTEARPQAFDRQPTSAETPTRGSVETRGTIEPNTAERPTVVREGTGERPTMARETTADRGTVTGDRAENFSTADRSTATGDRAMNREATVQEPQQINAVASERTVPQGARPLDPSAPEMRGTGDRSFTDARARLGTEPGARDIRSNAFSERGTADVRGTSDVRGRTTDVRGTSDVRGGTADLRAPSEVRATIGEPTSSTAFDRGVTSDVRGTTEVKSGTAFDRPKLTGDPVADLPTRNRVMLEDAQAMRQATTPQEFRDASRAFRQTAADYNENLRTVYPPETASATSARSIDIRASIQAAREDFALSRLQNASGMANELPPEMQMTARRAMYAETNQGFNTAIKELQKIAGQNVDPAVQMSVDAFMKSAQELRDARAMTNIGDGILSPVREFLYYHPNLPKYLAGYVIGSDVVNGTAWIGNESLSYKRQQQSQAAMENVGATSTARGADAGSVQAGQRQAEAANASRQAEAASNARQSEAVNRVRSEAAAAEATTARPAAQTNVPAGAAATSSAAGSGPARGSDATNTPPMSVPNQPPLQSAASSAQSSSTQGPAAQSIGAQAAPQAGADAGAAKQPQTQGDLSRTAYQQEVRPVAQATEGFRTSVTSLSSAFLGGMTPVDYRYWNMRMHGGRMDDRPIFAVGVGSASTASDVVPVQMAQQRQLWRTDATDQVERPTNRSFNWRSTQLDPTAFGRRDGIMNSNPYTADARGRVVRGVSGRQDGQGGSNTSSYNNVRSRYPFLAATAETLKSKHVEASKAPGAENNEALNTDGAGTSANTNNDPTYNDPTMAMQAAANDPNGQPTAKKNDDDLSLTTV